MAPMDGAFNVSGGWDCGRLRGESTLASFADGAGVADPSQKHVDDRLDAIRGRCEAARSHLRAAARDADNIHARSLWVDLMGLTDGVDRASEKADHIALMQQVAQDAWDSDIDRDREAEYRRDHIALVDERYEARKVGREEL